MNNSSYFITITLLGVSTAVAQTNLINFDTGTQGSVIGSFYACEGVIMTNAAWTTNRDARGEPFAGSSGSYVLWGQVNGSSPTSQAPIVARFTSPVSYVSILATDVGTAGARMEAFDAETGGNYLGGAEFYGGGVGFDVYTNLQLVAEGIRRVHLFQVFPNGSDGMVWDNLRYGPVATSSADVDLKLYAGLQISGNIGCTYQVQYADEVAGSNWVALTNLMLPSSPYLWIDPQSATNRHKFYRAIGTHL